MAQAHLRSGQVLALPSLQSTHRATSALLKARQLEVVHLVLPLGKRMPRHAAPGEITLLGLSGTLALGLDSGTVHLGAGDFIHLPAGEPHAVHALTSATALLTLSLPANASTSINPTNPDPRKEAP